MLHNSFGKIMRDKLAVIKKRLESVFSKIEKEFWNTDNTAS